MSPRPIRRRSTRSTYTPFRLAVVTRDVYEITNSELAAHFRGALQRGDLEVLDDLITYVNDLDGGPTETLVLDVNEVK